MIYEILIRGNNKGQIVGGHVIRFNNSGTIGLAESIPMVGQNLDFDGILPESLQNIVATQNLEKQIESLTQQLSEANQQIADLKSRLESTSQQIVSQEEILARLNALEGKQQ